MCHSLGSLKSRTDLILNDNFIAYSKKVVVHVINELLTEGVTVHWHGVTQLYTPWMDGSAYITQVGNFHDMKHSLL